MCRGYAGGSRPLRTSCSLSGSGSGQSFQKVCCGQYACGKPIRTGRKSVIKSDDAARTGRELRSRYTPADLSVFTQQEANRFIPGGRGDPRTDSVLAWELVYRLEPELYDRLVTAERLHPGIIDWLPPAADRIVEVGAGTGRLTMELINRAPEVVAVEPAMPLRAVLQHKLDDASGGDRVRVVHGFFDDLPLPDDYADLVVACSAFTPDPAHGGNAGLAEMER